VGGGNRKAVETLFDDIELGQKLAAERELESFEEVMSLSRPCFDESGNFLVSKKTSNLKTFSYIFPPLTLFLYDIHLLTDFWIHHRNKSSKLVYKQSSAHYRCQRDIGAVSNLLSVPRSASRGCSVCAQ